MTHFLKKVLCTVFLLIQMTHPLAQTIQSNQFIQLAQLDSTSTIDLDPPQVDHIPIASGVAGSSQSISVKASDLQGIASVTLLYRSNTNDEYKRILMREVTGTGNYIAALETSADQRLIEYYFLVIDTGGNKVLNGFPYEPFSRNLTAPQLQLNQAASPDTATSNEVVPDQNTAVAQQATDNSSRNKTILWVALGVIAVGLLAAKSGGGDDGATHSEETVPVILNIPLPE